MNSYLLTFDQNKTSRDDVIVEIDKIKIISNWMFFFDNTACLVADTSTSDLTECLRERLPDMHFLIVPLQKNERSGWLRKSVWNFIKHPKSVNS